MRQCGTYSKYVAGCRCEACTKANRVYAEFWRRRHGAKPRGPSAVHGTRSRYTRGCRCEQCTKANRDYAREQRRRSILDKQM